MQTHEFYYQGLKTNLIQVSSAEKAESSRRYFPHGINCIGANAGDIKQVIQAFQTQYSELSADDTLELCEYLLQKAEYNEETLIAFGLLNKFVKRHYDDGLLVRFEYWLTHYANNWALVDDLCIKTIYLFFMGRPHLIEKTQHWSLSDVAWCRRASNVVWVKFIKRKIGQSMYCLDTQLIFTNCDQLINDKDEFVQKSVGWLLKVTSIEHERAVIQYIEKNINTLSRSTLRYAIEKMAPATRKHLLAFGR
ncbi:DNA alkylation repair protein [Algibacillus agarilyticus]|uniref:DNA alkylation repair protein n=1 Tax=Algibacillus agarilyticus TaxID=2234133 RepID=UPI000DD03D0B|nr:DNA alkylation repair protein [Algibacillus agarilyticus]